MGSFEAGISLVRSVRDALWQHTLTRRQGNLVLQDTIERLFVQDLYADIERGLFLVRGENVLLLGEIDLDKDDYIPEPFQAAPVEKVFALKKAEDQERKKVDKKKHIKLAALGFEGENHGEAII